jgi:hypothetical protein
MESHIRGQRTQPRWDEMPKLSVAHRGNHIRCVAIQNNGKWKASISCKVGFAFNTGQMRQQ